MKISLILSFFLVANLAQAQLGEIYSIGRSTADDIASKKQGKLFSKHLVMAAVCNDSLAILRVPEEKIKSRSAPYIIRAQRDLEHARGQCARGEAIDTERLEQDLYIIVHSDPEWEVDLYRSELHQYAAYMNHRREQEALRLRREREVRDSINVAKLEAERHRQDSIHHAEMLKLEIQRMRRDSIWHAEEQQHIMREAEERKAQETRYATPTPKARSSSSGSSGSSGGHREGRTYYTGPKGGCYYLSGSGRRVYVDHSFCR